MDGRYLKYFKLEMRLCSPFLVMSECVDRSLNYSHCFKVTTFETSHQFINLNLQWPNSSIPVFASYSVSAPFSSIFRTGNKQNSLPFLSILCSQFVICENKKVTCFLENVLNMVCNRSHTWNVTFHCFVHQCVYFFKPENHSTNFQIVMKNLK